MSENPMNFYGFRSSWNLLLREPPWEPPTEDAEIGRPPTITSNEWGHPATGTPKPGDGMPGTAYVEYNNYISQKPYKFIGILSSMVKNLINS